MIKFYFKPLILLIYSTFFIWGCDNNKANESLNTDEMKIREIHNKYVNGWMKMDEAIIIGLMEENAIIQPNKLKPIEGRTEINVFWFPKDGSKTVINEYKTEIISLNIIDTLAISTHKSLLDWTYAKDTVLFGMIQKGINTTVYRKQSDSSWKIWRSMWTDIYSERK
jgi:ketosteroid isomerase-like protein